MRKWRDKLRRYLGWNGITNSFCRLEDAYHHFQMTNSEKEVIEQCSNFGIIRECIFRESDEVIIVGFSARDIRWILKRLRKK